MSKSQCTHTRNLYLSHNSLLSNCMGMILNTIVVHVTGVFVAGGICPIRTCLVVTGGAVVAEWLSSWLAEQEDRGSIPGLAT